MSIVLNNKIGSGQNCNFITDVKYLINILESKITDSKYSEMHMYIAYATDGGVKELIKILSNRKTTFKCNINVGLDQGITTYSALQELINFRDDNQFNHIKLTLKYILLDVNFHSKVIQLKGNTNYSTIIGSANLTNGGLHRNIETGILLEDNKQLYDEIQTYFKTFKPILINDNNKLNNLYNDNILGKRKKYNVLRNKKNVRNRHISNTTDNIFHNQSPIISEDLNVCNIPLSRNGIEILDVVLEQGIEYLWADAWPATGDNDSQLQLLNLSSTYFGSSEIDLTIRFSNKEFAVKWKKPRRTSYRISSIKGEFLRMLNETVSNKYNIFLFAKDVTSLNTFDLICVHEDNYSLLESMSYKIKYGSSGLNRAGISNPTRRKTVGLINI
jgi:HKD family nuclease